MEDELESGVVKKFLYINRRAPHGSIYAHEALEVVLIGAAFDQDVSLLLLMMVFINLKKIKIQAISIQRIFQKHTQL